MHPALGNLLCLLGVVPGLPLEAFLWTLSRTGRPHHVIGVLRSLLQTLATVSSPVRIAFTFMVLIVSFIADVAKPPRETSTMAIVAIGLVFSTQLALVSQGAGAELGAAIPAAAATLFSFSWSSRLWAETALT